MLYFALLTFPKPLDSEIFSANEPTPPSKPEARRCRCKNSKKCRHPSLYPNLPPNKATVYSQFPNRYWDLSIKKPEPIKAKAIRPIWTYKLTDKMMRTCIANLGTDAKNCYYGLQEFKVIQDFPMLEKFKDIYKPLETINVLYLSVTQVKESDKIEAVYLWQMNEKCPCIQREEEQQSILTDVKSKLTNTRYFPSLLLLAKIVPETGEEVLEAKILGDNKLLVQSKITSETTNTFELIYKIFNVASFEQSARVNPLQQNILANPLYTWKLKVHPLLSEGQNTVQVSIMKKSTLEEEVNQSTLIDEKKNHERSYNSATSASSLNPLTFVAYSHDGWTILLDKISSVFIVWRENDIHTFSFTEMMGTIHTFEVIKETLCVLINTKGQIYTLNIRELPSRTVQAIPHVLPIAVENLSKIQLFDVQDEKNNLKAVVLAYFWEGKFYRLNILGNEPVTVLLDLKDRAPKQEFGWRLVEREKQRVLFYVKNNALKIHDLEKSRHQTQKLWFENSQQKPQDWQIYADSPNKLYVCMVGSTEIFASEINYKGEIDNFFKDKNAIQMQYFAGESQTNNKTSQNIVQIETPFRGNSILLLRMKESVYQDDLHSINYDGPLCYIPPNISKELGKTQEKRERCPYHKLVDRVEIIQKHAERHQYDAKCAEEAEQIQKDIQELITKRMNESKEKQKKYEEYVERINKRYEPNLEVIYEPEEVDFKKYLDLYKNIKQVQKSLKAAKMRQSARPKNDVI